MWNIRCCNQKPFCKCNAKKPQNTGLSCLVGLFFPWNRLSNTFYTWLKKCYCCIRCYYGPTWTMSVDVLEHLWEGLAHQWFALDGQEGFGNFFVPWPRLRLFRVSARASLPRSQWRGRRWDRLPASTVVSSYISLDIFGHPKYFR